MDFGLREWLFIFGLLVIAGILFDGWRRMGGRSKIRFKLERNLSDLPEEGGNDELLGPPRVVNRNERAEPSFGGDGDALSADDGSQWHEPEQVGLDLDEPPVLVDPVAAEPRSKKAAADKPARKTDAEPKPEQQSLPVELVLVINVVSRDEQGFSGSALHQSILESGLRFGDMNIFHRHESMSGNGDVLFSMANALKPGVFDLDELDQSHVRAVSFFMGLPGPRHPKQALDLMIAAARKLSHELGGDLKDEQRSVLTAQTIEHYRQRIAEYERLSYSQRR
ncbi:MAG TPA: cell division protein ZipA [Pseudomonas sp.]|jgi:cell division protein ZipA|nr:cell division protein ZipA [Pseudomonas sp.]MAQ50801.1 cell division protein ZipA [Pseudomonas sp.]MBB50947.1 cell division protein ZipA [Pseudomonadales bacterium]HCA23356.1 cell division protein ZipA [Pseudomonas sp.]|tara:strand:- start:2 stop:841 length:840 start_codon:yes stop_codon:yes gene_type:complete